MADGYSQSMRIFRARGSWRSRVRAVEGLAEPDQSVAGGQKRRIGGHLDGDRVAVGGGQVQHDLQRLNDVRMLAHPIELGRPAAPVRMRAANACRSGLPSGQSG
jgi:hypothetical protein